MGFNAFNYGANAVCFEKNGRKYGMICSWATQVDYDKVVMLLGAQSATGRNIAKGDIIGVSVLSAEQEDVMERLGNHHSDQMDKLAGLVTPGWFCRFDQQCQRNHGGRYDIYHLPGIGKIISSTG